MSVPAHDQQILYTDNKPASNIPAHAWVATIGLNIALPVTTYFALTAVGMATVPALLISGGWPALDLAVTLRRQRHLDELALFAWWASSSGWC